MRTGLVYHPDYLLHDTGPGHPERPQRLTWILKGLEKEGLLERFERFTPSPASEDIIGLVHPPSYQAWLRRMCADANTLDPDTRVCPASWDIARLAVGGVTQAVDAICAGALQRALVLPRPPGHHATATRAMGFCLLNNVAIGARYAQHRYGVSRVAIVDWDVHHGNGTQDIFYEDGSVLYVSLHQYPYYPGTGGAEEIGTGAGRGATLNCPLPAGATDDDYVRAMETFVVPALTAFRPELLLMSAGFDGHRDDPLAQMALTEAGFARLTACAVGVAEACCGGRVVSVLEGGYHPRALPASVAAHARGLLEDSATSTIKPLGGGAYAR